MQTWEEKKFNNTGVDSVSTKKGFLLSFFSRRGEKKEKSKDRLDVWNCIVVFAIILLLAFAADEYERSWL